MKQRLIAAWKPLFGIALFTAAIWALHKELKAYHYADVVKSLHELTWGRVTLALGLTLLSYFSMGGYDWLAFRYIEKPLSYAKIAMASFIGYAFSNNIGLSVVSGGSVRYRLYSAWGISAVDITKVVAFCTLTLWLGFISTGAVAFLVWPLVIPSSLHFPFGDARPLGALFALALVAYVAGSVWVKKPLKIRSFELSFPVPRMVAAQLVVSAVDWVLAATVLYVLIRHLNMGFPEFLGVFLLAQIAGLLSQLPGGLGVFETVVVALLTHHAPASAILGPLVAYRLVYYLVPLALAALGLGVHEAVLRREQVSNVAKQLGQWLPGVVPNLLAFTSFLSGAVLLFSGATPPVKHRALWLGDVLPLAVLELSHFLGSIVGLGLMLLARGLQRRLDAAYHLALWLLSAGIVLSLLKGLDWEEGVILLVMLLALAPCRAYFHRQASLINQRFSAGWVASIALVLGAAVWLGFFAFKHVDYSRELFWQFELSASAPRALRATVAAIAGAGLFGMMRLLKPSPPAPAPPTVAELDVARPIAQACPDTIAYLALLGDKELLFNDAKTAFIMYGIEGRSWVSLRDPIGSDADAGELIWRFRELSDLHGGWTVFYQVDASKLHLYLELGLSFFKLGEEARVKLETFSLEGSSRKNLRYVQRKLEKEGFVFSVLTAEESAQAMPELKSISDSWLQEKSAREKGFSLGFFDAAYLAHFPNAVVKNKDGKLVAFANLWPGGDKEELSIDLMRYLPDFSNGVMDYLFLSLMLWGKSQGYKWFNMGMAPLSGLEDHQLAPLWNRMGARLFRLGENFYNFQGLRQYKEKFDPVWLPKYLAAPGGLALPGILTNVVALVSRGLTGAVGK